jgi:heat shock protein HslJ
MKPLIAAAILFLYLLFAGCSMLFPQRNIPADISREDNLPHGTFYLELIGHSFPSDTGIPDQTPSLDINASDSTISGFSGCNRYHATFDVAGDTIITGLIAATKKACPELQFEQAFLEILSNSRFKWQSTGERLMLTGAGTQLIFRR